MYRLNASNIIELASAARTQVAGLSIITFGSLWNWLEVNHAQIGAVAQIIGVVFLLVTPLGRDSKSREKWKEHFRHNPEDLYK